MAEHDCLWHDTSNLCLLPHSPCRGPVLEYRYFLDHNYTYWLCDAAVEQWRSLEGDSALTVV
jgi:hypothetical protein